MKQNSIIEKCKQRKTSKKYQKSISYHTNQTIIFSRQKTNI